MNDDEVKVSSWWAEKGYSVVDPAAVCSPEELVEMDRLLQDRVGMFVPLSKKIDPLYTPCRIILVSERCQNYQEWHRLLFCGCLVLTLNFRDHMYNPIDGAEHWRAM